MWGTCLPTPQLSSAKTKENYAERQDSLNVLISAVPLRGEVSDSVRRNRH